MPRNSGNLFFVVLFIAAICTAVCIQTPAFAQALRSEVPLTDFFDDAGTGSNNDEAIGGNPVTNRIYLLGKRQGNSTKSLLVLDARDYSQLAVIPLGIDGFDTGGVAVNPQTNRIYVALTDGLTYQEALVAVDGSSNSVVATISLPLYNGSLRGPVVDTISNRIYVMSYSGRLSIVDGNTNSLITTFETNFSPAGGVFWGGYNTANGMAINSNTHRVYVPKYGLLVIDGTNNSFTIVPLPPNFGTDSEIVVNPNTNRIYISGYYFSGDKAGKNAIVVLDGATNTLIAEILLPFGYSIFESELGPVTIGINTATNRIYKYGSEQRTVLGLATIDGNTNTLLSHSPVAALSPSLNDTLSFYMAINPNSNLIYSTGHGDPTNNTVLAIIDPGSTQITTTGSVTTTADNATLNFSNVTNPGAVSVAPISDPATAGDVPGGFAISDTAAYEITKDASLQFNGPVTTCFSVPTVTAAATFATLRVLHRELNVSTGQYELVDRTTSSDFSTHTICATTSSFSPFYIARAGNKIKSLFDRSKAYKAGSTVPVKLQLLNANGNNISSTATALTTRGLRLIGSNTSSGVIDAGNANPDGNFRYDAALQGYIFNLTTKGLTSGQYVLSLYAGSDHSFFYTVKFEVK